MPDLRAEERQTRPDQPACRGCCALDSAAWCHERAAHGPRRRGGTVLAQRRAVATNKHTAPAARRWRLTSHMHTHTHAHSQRQTGGARWHVLGERGGDGPAPARDVDDPRAATQRLRAERLHQEVGKHGVPLRLVPQRAGAFLDPAHVRRGRQGVQHNAPAFVAAALPPLARDRHLVHFDWNRIQVALALVARQTTGVAAMSRCPRCPLGLGRAVNAGTRPGAWAGRAARASRASGPPADRRRGGASPRGSKLPQAHRRVGAKALRACRPCLNAARHS